VIGKNHEELGLETIRYIRALSVGWISPFQYEYHSYYIYIFCNNHMLNVYVYPVLTCSTTPETLKRYICTT